MKMKKILSLVFVLLATIAVGAQTTGSGKATIGGNETDVEWVQLWAGGPKFAAYNIGATDICGYGNYFVGNTTTDYATANWGSNWKTASQDDYQGLKDNCTSKWVTKQDNNGNDVSGIEFTGKDDYEGNSIFLPAGGMGSTHDQINERVVYWTSTYGTNGVDVNSRYYFFGSEGSNGNEGKRDIQNATTANLLSIVLLVRAVYYPTVITLNETDETYPTAGVWDESTTYDITLNRTMKANQWNTLMLSFPMTAAEVKSNFGSDVTLMKMTGIEDNVVNFATVDLETDDATAIEVCEPYIVKPTAAITQIMVTGKTGLKNEIEENDHYLVFMGGEDYQLNYADRIFADWCVRSCFCSYTEDGSEWPTYGLNSDKFYTVDSEVSVKGYRWVIYDQSGDEARALTLSLDGVTTGIDAVSEGFKVSEGANGKLVRDAHQAKAVIQNGRMVIVKDSKKFNVNGQEVK